MHTLVGLGDSSVKPPGLLSSFSPPVSHSFQCPDSGDFKCSSTKLIFDMSQKAELQYETIKWDKRLLKRAGKKPAGPLFNIKCSEDAVAHLHLPHCAQKDGKTL